MESRHFCPSHGLFSEKRSSAHAVIYGRFYGFSFVGIARALDPAGWRVVGCWLVGVVASGIVSRPNLGFGERGKFAKILAPKRPRSLPGPPSGFLGFLCVSSHSLAQAQPWGKKKKVPIETPITLIRIAAVHTVFLNFGRWLFAEIPIAACSTMTTGQLQIVLVMGGPWAGLTLRRAPWLGLSILAKTGEWMN